MVFVVEFKEDKFVEKIFRKAVKQLNEFFGAMKWERNGRPGVILVSSRKDIDKLYGVKTPLWIVGWLDGKTIFLLDRKNYEKASSNKYSDGDYSMLLIHELVHAYFNNLSNNSYFPLWLSEGLAVYLAGQHKFQKKPKKFRKFISHYSDAGQEVYEESDFAVQFLVETHGKQKLLRLIKSLKTINSKKEFAARFKEIYEFDLAYKNFRVPD